MGNISYWGDFIFFLLRQWFSTFLMLRPFSKVLLLWWRQPNYFHWYLIIPVLLAMNQTVNNFGDIILPKGFWPTDWEPLFWRRKVLIGKGIMYRAANWYVSILIKQPQIMSRRQGNKLNMMSWLLDWQHKSQVILKLKKWSLIEIFTCFC